MQLPSISEAVPPSATWGRAVLLHDILPDLSANNNNCKDPPTSAYYNNYVLDMLNCWQFQTPLCVTLPRGTTGHTSPTQTSVLNILPNNLSEPRISDQLNALTKGSPPPPNQKPALIPPWTISWHCQPAEMHCLNSLPDSITQPTHAGTPVLTQQSIRMDMTSAWCPGYTMPCLCPHLTSCYNLKTIWHHTYLNTRALHKWCISEDTERWEGTAWSFIQKLDIFHQWNSIPFTDITPGQPTDV